MSFDLQGVGGTSSIYLVELDSQFWQLVNVQLTMWLAKFGTVAVLLTAIALEEGVIYFYAKSRIDVLAEEI